MGHNSLTVKSFSDIFTQILIFIGFFAILSLYFVMSKIAKNRAEGRFSDTKLAELLQGLTKEEYKRFGLFLRSPYHNKSGKMEKLYEYFKLRREKPDSKGVTKESISAYLDPSRKFDDTNLRKQLSNFAGLIEEFVIMLGLDSKPVLKRNLLLGESLYRNYPKVLVQGIRELYKSFDAEKQKDSEYYYNYHQTLRTHFLFKSKEMKNPEVLTNKSTFILDLYYISVKLLHYYTVLNLKLHYNKQVKFDNWAFDDIVRFIESHDEELSRNHISLYADYLSVKMMLNPDSAEPFNRLKDYVLNNLNKAGELEQHRMYIYLYNHSLYRFNKGYSLDSSELFEVIKDMESAEVPLWHYFAYHMYYINAVKYACMAGEHRWAENFMETRKDKVHDDIRQQTLSLAKANYYFLREDHDSALRSLINVDFPNYTFYLNAKTLLIKIYWEKSEAEGIFSAIDAMKQFLKRKDLIPERLWNCSQNFINCTAKMVDIKDENKEFEIRKLLEKEMLSSDKAWIEKQLSKKNYRPDS